MARCFLCGTQMTPRFETRDHARPHESTTYSLAWCSDCAYGTLAGAFTPNEVASFYPADYYTHAAEDAAAEGAGNWIDRLRVHLAWRTDKSINFVPGEVPRSKMVPTLCDVGCGSGLAMSEFKRAGYEVAGIDPDAAALALAAKVGEVFEGTAEALPEALAERRFDAVVLSHSLEHCIDPARALGNVKRLVARGGTAIIEVPNNAAVGFEMYGPGWFFADIPRHLQFFTERSLRKSLGQAGMRVTRVIYTGYTRQFMPAWLRNESRIRHDIGMKGGGGAWRLLARTAFARAEEKYDSIRVHATHEDSE